jgi:hypothetical protein
MPTENNPYAAPRADVNAGAGAQYAAPGAFWRSGPILMTRHAAVLPARCVKCNAELEAPPKKQRFYWHHQAWFALVLLNAIIYIVVAMIVRRHADVTYGLCALHRQRRKRGIWLSVGGILLSLALIFFGVTTSQPVLFLIALLGFLMSIVIAIVKSRTLLPVRIDKSGAQLKGCGEAFLASLPTS